MTTMLAEFDGKAFVPQQPVDLPVGTRVIVSVQAPLVEMKLPSNPPRKPTPDEDREWERILHDIRASEPFFPTVEDAMRYLRKRP